MKNNAASPEVVARVVGLYDSMGVVAQDTV